MLFAQAKPCAFTIETSLYQCAELFRALPGIANLQGWQVPPVPNITPAAGDGRQRRCRCPQADQQRPLPGAASSPFSPVKMKFLHSDNEDQGGHSCSKENGRFPALEAREITLISPEANAAALPFNRLVSPSRSPSMQLALHLGLMVLFVHR